MGDQPEEESTPRTENVIAFVCNIEGRWISRKYEGPLSDCIDAFDVVVAEHGAELQKCRWARAHTNSDKRIVVHPKWDSETEERAIKTLKSKTKPKRIRTPQAASKD